MDVTFIKKAIDAFPSIHLIGDINQNSIDGIVRFDITVDTGKENNCLKWTVKISPMYPFSFNNIDSLCFYNSDLLDYPHIMEGGLLCTHTEKLNDAETQFKADLNSLKEWVDKYYVHEYKDKHYDYPVINYYDDGESSYNFLYTQTDSALEVGDYGVFDYHNILKGQKGKLESNSYTITRFVSDRLFHATPANCQWSETYNSNNNQRGIYNMLSEMPVKYGKFIIKDYVDLGKFLTQEQINYIYRECLFLWRKKLNIPCLFGYKNPSGDINWQTVFLTQEDTPFDYYCEKTANKKRWNTYFTSGKIKWIRTIDCSYKYFFGRGAFPEFFCRKKILILGLGAIGSMVATTLTRCGAVSIDLYDIDEKLPENVCRSEYNFINGIGDKSVELSLNLRSISPFINCHCLNDTFDYAIKSPIESHEIRDKITKELNQYDLIFDCTTDNQLMFLLDKLGITSTIINLSISNKANELVCAFSPKIDESISFVYKHLTTPSKQDELYNPTGCWHSTFKASYNDINIKVSFALKHIVNMLCNKEAKANFWISDDMAGLKFHRL